MQLEKWQDILNPVKDKFTVEDEGQEAIDDIPNGTVEFVIFDGPLGRMRLEYIVKPVLLESKAIGSRRIGSDTTIQNTYSEDEFTNTFKAYKWDDADEDWIEMEKGAEAFSV